MERVQADIELTCCECTTIFVFTAGEQRFYEERGFVPPRRCLACRRARQGTAPYGRPATRPER